MEQGFVNRLIRRIRMQEALGRAKGRAGTGQLKSLLAGLLPQLPFTRSELERRFLKLVATSNLPMPIVNRHGAHGVDFHWPATSSSSRPTAAGYTTTHMPSRRIGGATLTSSSRTGMSFA